MNKGRYVNKKKFYMPIWLILIIVVILAAAVIFFFGRNTEGNPSETEGEIISQTDSVIETDAQSETAEQTDAAPSDENTETSASTEPEVTQQPTETQPPQVIVPQPTVVIVQQADAEYEKWLAAAMVVCVSMEYPDFEIEAIYAASATKLEDKFTSEGAYIVFTSGGSRFAIHAKALEAERTTPGTRDISTEVIGFATYDQVDPDSVDFSSMEKIAVEDLSELIAQSLLISIYAR